MRPAKGEKVKEVPTKKVEYNLDPKIIEQVEIMSNYTKISKDEIVTIALKRFISSHSDYFPPDYKASN